MFKFNSLYVIIAAIVLSALGGAYLAYNYQKNYYEAKISKERIKQQEAYDKAVAEKQAVYEKAVVSYTTALRDEKNKSNAYAAQLRKMELGSHSGSVCRVTYGFIRLFNASATGESTSPQESDSTTSTIELDTVLSTIIENHGKYREAARQVDAIRDTQK